MIQMPVIRGLGVSELASFGGSWADKLYRPVMSKHIQIYMSQIKCISTNELTKSIDPVTLG